MEQGGFVPYGLFPSGEHFGAEVLKMPDGEELEQRINDQIDRERIQTAILNLEIETLKKAVEKVENISGI